jgi:hypothetical protein
VRPNGRLKIARHFKAGKSQTTEICPAGRAEFDHLGAEIQQVHLHPRRSALPALKVAGYFRTSLWVVPHISPRT